MQSLISILNGPNLNLLGEREPAVYGRDSLADLEQACRNEAGSLGVEVDFRQTNHEGELVTWIQDCRRGVAGLILNAGAYTHTSVALLDALTVLSIPIIEVHLSNIFRRESFRHHSYVSPAATGVVCGLGFDGYRLALRALAARVTA
jgi:3-dehydroquinate dehydratase-2